jgi:predicted neutral ceramidase superfamily lipid hydrolase
LQVFADAKRAPRLFFLHRRSFLFTGKMLPYYKLVRSLTFPSTSKILSLLFGVSLVGSVLAFTLAARTWEAATQGLGFGFIVLFLPAIITDAISSILLLRDDPLFYLRRCFALSLFSCALWILIMCLGGVVRNISTGLDFPQQPFFLALFTVMPLRSLAVTSMSSKRISNKILFAFFQPFAFSLAAILLLDLDVSVFVNSFFAATVLSLVPLLLLLRFIESRGHRMVRASPLRVFRAFLVDWLSRKNELFESFLEEIGSEGKVEITLIKFHRKESDRPKALIVVSDFHPGPFLNVGSSELPYLIQRNLENKEGLVVAVPHGISGHEHNLVSQAQNSKVISAIISLLENSDLSSNASAFNRFEVGSAKVGAQVFGECLLLTLTQSPRDMEDIPLQLGEDLEQLAKKRFKYVAIVDSHNSIAEARVFTKQEIANLRSAASQAIESLAAVKTDTFEMGAAKSILRGFGPEDGIGPGGIIAFVFKTSDRLTAYVTVDANNMAPGLREKIISSLKGIDITGGEIMTTDTHVVNGLVPARLGYHPLGDAVSQDIVIETIRETVKKAKEDLEEARVSSSSVITEVRSLGSQSLENLTSFMYGVAKLVAAYMVIMFAVSNLVGLALVP